MYTHTNPSGGAAAGEAGGSDSAAISQIIDAEVPLQMETKEDADAEVPAAQIHEPEAPASPGIESVGVVETAESAAATGDRPISPAAPSLTLPEESAPVGEPAPTEAEPAEGTDDTSAVVSCETEEARVATPPPAAVPAPPTDALPSGKTTADEIEANETEEEMPCSAGFQVFSHSRTGSVDGGSEPPVVSLGEMLTASPTSRKTGLSNEIVRQHESVLAVLRGAQEEVRSLP